MGLRRALLAVLLVALPGIASPNIGRAAITTPYAAAGEEQIASGVRHEWGALTVNGTGGRNVNVLEIDLADPQIDMRLSQAAGIASETRQVVDQALAYSQDGRRVVATTNGSLFSYLRADDLAVGGMGLGLNVSDGELINAGYPAGRSSPIASFGITDQGDAVIGVPQVQAQLELPGGELADVERINQTRAPGETALYTDRVGTHTWTDDLGDEYVIDGFALPLRTSGTYTGTIVEIRDGIGDSAIGPGQAVLSVSDSAEQWSTQLSVGAEISVTLTVNEPWRSIRQSVGGRDLLLYDGHVVPPEAGRDGNHARTAVGIDAHGKVILLSADDGTLAKGLRLGDLTSLLQSRGAVYALNLDGGGSTQMAVRHPGDVDVSLVTPWATTDFISRRVANALQVVSMAPLGPLDRLVLSPAHAEATPGESIDLTVKGQDASSNGIELEPSSLEWAVEGTRPGDAQPAFQVTPTGATFTAIDPGDYSVTVRNGSITATSSLVIGDFVAPSVVGVSVGLVDTGTIGKSSVRVAVGWTAVDNVGVARVEVQRHIASGKWKSITVSGPSAVAASTEVGFGKRIQFRVRAVDAAGNTGEWITSQAYRVALVEPSNKQIRLSSGWEKKSAAGTIGGRFMRARAPAAAATFTFSGVQVAVIGNRGPIHGDAEIYVGGSLVSMVTNGASTLQPRRILYLSPLATATASSTAKIVNRGTGARPTLDIDGFLVLTPIT